MASRPESVTTTKIRAPSDIATRLRVGWGDLTGYENHDGLLVADGDAVIYEHCQTWTFKTGDVVLVFFATVHRVCDDRVFLWKDYWDYNAIMTTAPASWVDCLRRRHQLALRRTHPGLTRAR